MTATYSRTALVLIALLLAGACTHRIEAPSEPIRIEMTVLLKHEHLLRHTTPGG